MVSVEPSSWHESDEELRTVGVFAVVGHWDPTSRSMAQDEILIDELVSVDALAASTVAVQDITALDDEITNDSVNWSVFEWVLSL